MRLALAQIGSGTDKVHNLELIRDSARTAADQGAELVVFPEYSMYEKKAVDRTYSEAAEPLEGPFAQALAQTARELGVTLVVGIIETSENGRPYNTLAAVDAHGNTAARYRKVHLFDSYGFRESDYISPSDTVEPVVFDVGDLRVGLMTCYDLRFPELARELVDAGAGLILVCSSWVPGDGKADQWRILAQARAIENGCYVGAVSQTPPVSIGQSLLVDPSGRVLGQLAETPTVATFDIEAEVVTAARERDPALLRRRYSIRRSRPQATGNSPPE